MLETSRFIETPEGVRIHISPAGPVPRALAWGIDLAIRGALFLALRLALGTLGEFGTGLALLVAFALEWLYPVLFEVLNHGRTPGKRVLRVRVVRDDGAPVGWPAAMVRNLLRAADFLPLLYGFGLVAMASTDGFKRLGDLAAGTVVVYDPEPVTAPPAPAVDPLPPPWQLAPAEQRALADFAERAATLSDERAAEVAGLLVPGADAPVTQLRRYAAWLGGHR